MKTEYLSKEVLSHCSEIDDAAYKNYKTVFTILEKH